MRAKTIMLLFLPLVPQHPKEPYRPHVSTARLLLEKQRSQRTSTLNKQRPDLVETPAPQALQL